LVDTTKLDTECMLWHLEVYAKIAHSILKSDT